jgi:phage protein U
MPMMSLGMFLFALDSVPYQELSRKQAWRHGRTERVGAFAAAQFMGPGDDTVSISGALIPPLAGTYSNLRVLEAIAEQGEAQPLVDSEGVVWGHYTIEGLDRKQSYIMADGIPRKVDFTIELKRVR